MHYVLGYPRLLLVLLYDSRCAGWTRLVICMVEVSMMQKSRIIAGVLLAVLSISACAGQAPGGNQPNPIGQPQSTVDPKLPPMDGSKPVPPANGTPLPPANGTPLPPPVDGTNPAPADNQAPMQIVAQTFPVTVWNYQGITLQPSDVGVAPGQPVADQSAIELPDGRVRLYFFAQNKGIMSAISSDGLKFTTEAGMRLPDGSGMPRAFVLPDKRIRLYFITGDGVGSAISDDGLAFTVEPGVRINSRDTVLPKLSGVSVVATDSGYRAYFSDLPIPGTGPMAHAIYSATSSDGLTWQVEANPRIGAPDISAPSAMAISAEHPFVLREKDGSYTMYFARNATIWSATSTDGLAWSNEQSTLVAGNDPDVLVHSNGTRSLYYGDFRPTIGGYLLVARQQSAPWDIQIGAKPGAGRAFTVALTGTSTSPLTVTPGYALTTSDYTITPASQIAPGTVTVTISDASREMPAILVTDGTLTRSVMLQPQMMAPPPKP